MSLLGSGHFHEFHQRIEEVPLGGKTANIQSNKNNRNLETTEDRSVDK
jgi:hypothetical protein